MLVAYVSRTNPVLRVLHRSPLPRPSGPVAPTLDARTARRTVALQRGSGLTHEVCISSNAQQGLRGAQLLHLREVLWILGSHQIKKNTENFGCFGED